MVFLKIRKADLDERRLSSKSGKLTLLKATFLKIRKADFDESEFP